MAVEIISLFLVLVFLALVIGGIVYLVLWLRKGTSLTIPFRWLFRLYFYFMTIVGLLILTFGLSHLVRAGLGIVLGKEFSYYPKYPPVMFLEPIPPPPPDNLMPPKIVPTPSPEELARLRQQGLERSFREGLVDGFAQTVVGGVIWGVHLWIRRRFETIEEAQDLLNRAYLILILVIFGIITIINLPRAISETLRFYLLESKNTFPPPGEPLSIALVALPIWIIYLASVLRLMRRNKTKTPTTD